MNDRKFDDYSDLKPKKKKSTKDTKSRRLTFQELDDDNLQTRFYYNNGHKKHKRSI